MLSKSLEDLTNISKFNAEFTGVVHAMVLELYNQQGLKLPKPIRDYKFRNVNPWGDCEVDL